MSVNDPDDFLECLADGWMPPDSEVAELVTALAYAIQAHTTQLTIAAAQSSRLHAMCTQIMTQLRPRS
jgi:hypothetical protein